MRTNAAHMHPRVLVGCPVSSVKAYCTQAYVEGIQLLTHANKEVLLMDNSPGTGLEGFFKPFKSMRVQKTLHTQNVMEMIVRDRNALRQYALDHDFDYFLSLEQDVIPPKDIVERLLSNEKEVCSAVYFHHVRSDPHWIGQRQISVQDLVPLAYNFGSKQGEAVQMFFDQVFPARVQEVFFAGLGCMLISRRVLENISFRFEEGKPAFDDAFFGADCAGHGFKQYLDSRAVCMHHSRPWGAVSE